MSPPSPPPLCMMHDLFRALWQLKKQEERDLLFRDVEQLKQLQRLKMFGRFVPHHTLQCRYLRLCWVGVGWVNVCYDGLMCVAAVNHSYCLYHILLPKQSL